MAKRCESNCNVCKNRKNCSQLNFNGVYREEFFEYDKEATNNMDGVRETLCSSCSHREVCSHKEDYLAMVASLQETFQQFPEKEREFMALRDPDCKFNSKELSVPRFVTNVGAAPEGMIKAARNAMENFKGGTSI